MLRQVKELFEEQLRGWPLLASGVEALACARTRLIRVGWSDIYVRHIPHRLASTTASVDPDSVARRPCFLCLGHLPPEEKGLELGDFVVYCNPFPIVDRHLTIVHRYHVPQRIGPHFGEMLDLATNLPGYFVIYNGPECGASAPDHMHFQAGLRNIFPIERETASINGTMVPGYSRKVLLFRGNLRSELVDRLNRCHTLLAGVTNRRAEPLLNIAVFRQSDVWTVYVFPRQKHRPDAFYSGELTVSPAAIDLCGIFVVPVADDFERITSEALARVFCEISLSDARFQEVIDKLEMRT